MRIKDETVDRIRQAADIVEVVGDFVSLKKRGSNWTACCPFHNEKSPSFNVNPVRQIYKCFGCGKAGDAVKFVMEIDGISYPEALRYLAQKYSIEIEEKQQTPEEQTRQNERDSLYIVLEYAAKFYKNQLFNTEEGQSIGLSYFKERGFNHQTIESFGLGYSPEAWDTLAKQAVKDSYNPEILEKAGLVVRKDDGRSFDRFRNRVIFPIHNVAGKVIAFGARILTKDKNQPKYLNSPESDVYHKSQILYGIYQAKTAIRNEDNALLVEGYTDVVSLFQAGIQNVVASSGTSLTIEQIRLIARFTTNITILYDGDAAGIKAALRGLDMVLQEGLNVSIVTFPDGEDPDSYVQRAGTEGFKQHIKNNTKDFITFKTNSMLADAGDNPFKRAQVITDIVESISQIPDAIKRQVFFRQTASRLGVDEQTLLSESNKIIRKNADQKHKEAERANLQSNRTQPSPTDPAIEAFGGSFSEDNSGGNDPAVAFETPDIPQVQRTRGSYQEEECVRLLVNYGTHELETGISLCHYVLSELGTISFQTPVYQHILTMFREAFNKGEVLPTNHFLGHYDPDVQRVAIDLVVQRYEVSPNWTLKHEIIVKTETDVLADMAYGNVLRIKKNIAEQRLKDLNALLKQNPNPEQEMELLVQFMHFKKMDVEIANLLGTVVTS